MREIRFRGKSIVGEWVYGDLMQNKQKHTVFIGGQDGSFDKVDPDTVGQFTGLKDKNGVDIYEGDIIKGLVVSYTADVEESLTMLAGWYIQGDNYERWDYLRCLDDEYEVQGNIHDHPPMIK